LRLSLPPPLMLHLLLSSPLHQCQSRARNSSNSSSSSSNSSILHRTLGWHQQHQRLSAVPLLPPLHRADLLWQRSTHRPMPRMHIRRINPRAWLHFTLHTPICLIMLLFLVCRGTPCPHTRSSLGRLVVRLLAHSTHRLILLIFPAMRRLQDRIRSIRCIIRTPCTRNGCHRARGQERLEHRRSRYRAIRRFGSHRPRTTCSSRTGNSNSSSICLCILARPVSHRLLRDTHLRRRHTRLSMARPCRCSSSNNHSPLRLLELLLRRCSNSSNSVCTSSNRKRTSSAWHRSLQPTAAKAASRQPNLLSPLRPRWDPRRADPPLLRLQAPTHLLLCNPLRSHL